MKLREDKVKDLSEEWVRQFGFNPFLGLSREATIERKACIECGLIYYFPEFFGDAEFYSKLSKNYWYYESEKWEFDRAVDLIRRLRPRSVLEIGCGAGEFLQKVQSAVDVCVGIDINESALDSARLKGLDVSTKKIGQVDNTFDMIVLFEVLEHLESPRSMLEEIERKLNPGGVVVIAVPNPEGYLGQMGVVLLDMPPHHCTGWKKETFGHLARMLRMSEICYEVEPLRYIHFQGLLASVIRQGARSRVQQKLQAVVSRLLAPALFVAGGNRLVGQTHLVALQKAG